ncbi:hypothetical protein O5O45_08375 [Hahella aquimaris]|uniref:hypothetical protein n=1 Tax=Hahella sp. HNIBRBA332 TaxID=3015983 RepID=UPI00273CAF7F|nr:hypothetical protein [Hahella sp. HNIBRBA332]WLQ15929.1 hypothetical protein O5O45_08375 [Hahella sp. HNIBRBA332]
MSLIKLLKPLVLAFPILVSGCVNHDGIVTGLDGEPVQVAHDEIMQKKCYLSRVSNLSDLHDKTEGGAVFEGVVVDKEVDASSMAKVQVKTSWILYGVKSAKVFVETSEKSPYGVDFVVGESYRILAHYDESDQLKTWTWLGTYNLKDKSVCEQADLTAK